MLAHTPPHNRPPFPIRVKPTRGTRSSYFRRIPRTRKVKLLCPVRGTCVDLPRESLLGKGLACPLFSSSSCTILAQRLPGAKSTMASTKPSLSRDRESSASRPSNAEKNASSPFSSTNCVSVRCFDEWEKEGEATAPTRLMFVFGL